MAGDWIKMRVDLADDPAVIGIAAALEIEEDLVVGKLHRLWSWADRQTVDGNAPSVTRAWLDRYLSAPGFADALSAAGWLVVTPGGIQLPDFAKHNGQTGKQRALTAKRAAKSRSRNSNACSVTKSAPREEKRREEKSDYDLKDSSLKEAQENHLSLALRRFAGGAVPMVSRGDLNDDQIHTMIASAALADWGLVSEHAIAGACEGVRRRAGGPPKDPVAYFVRSVTNNTTSEFSLLLRSVAVPPELIREWKATL